MKLDKLATVDQSVPIDTLSEEQLKDLQRALSWLGYPVGEVDGLIGPKTRGAWAEFANDMLQSHPERVDPEAVAILQNKLDELFSLQIYDFTTVAGTKAAIKQECQLQGIGLNTQIAYVLATVEWETAKTFKPVKEAFWLSEEWRRENLRYYPYYGRGYVQLTWRNNYAKYGQILGIDLVNKPDLAMEPPTSLFILVHGFKTGTFTGRKITDYINEHTTNFYDCRRCINGLDKAGKIARIAENYLDHF